MSTEVVNGRDTELRFFLSNSWRQLTMAGADGRRARRPYKSVSVDYSTNHSPYTTWVTRPGLYREPRQCTVDSAAETRRRGLYPASDASKNVVSSPVRSSPWAGRVVRMAERRRNGGREAQARVAGWCHLRVRQAGGGKAAAGRGVVVVPCMSALGGRGGSKGTRHVGQGGGGVGCPRVRVG